MSALTRADISEASETIRAFITFPISTIIIFLIICPVHLLADRKDQKTKLNSGGLHHMYYPLDDSFKAPNCTSTICQDSGKVKRDGNKSQSLTKKVTVLNYLNAFFRPPNQSVSGSIK